MMRSGRRVLPWVCLTGTAALLGLVAVSTVPPRAPPSPPRLAVLVVFDQMRADYLVRWQDLFEDGGFRRLQTQGAWFQNCHYPYAFTYTAPGHASLLTGTCPDRHGIIENDWYDRSAGATVSSVAERGAGGELGRKAPATAVSPDRLLSLTVGDVLKKATGGKGRVVALSLKDRAAVLSGGHRADACYWFDGTTGNFITSAYYRGLVHPWVAEFNRGRPADRWLGQEWTRERSGLNYAAYSGPDGGPGEGIGFGQGREFPHPFPELTGTKYYQALFNSPFGNDLLLELAEKAIDAEQLGGRAVPDLLCLSFSSNDGVGHCWGPDSQEVLDVTLRSDRVIKELLAYLDERVGRGRYVLALTADHGVCPLPEVSLARGRDAGRVASDLLLAQAEVFLRERFGKPREKVHWIEALSGPWLYLNRAWLREQGRVPAEVETALADWLKKQRGIQAAYTRTQLMSGLPEDDDIGRRVRRSFSEERSGDVAVVPKPYWILWPSFPGTGTTHGTPNPYDTHVPLLVYGPGIPGGANSEAVTPQAVAAILSRALNIPVPADAETPVPRCLR